MDLEESEEWYLDLLLKIKEKILKYTIYSVKICSFYFHYIAEFVKDKALEINKII